MAAEIKMEFLSPTTKDNFGVVKHEDNIFTIMFKESSAKIRAKKLDDGSVSFNYIEMKLKTEEEDYHLKKT